MSRLVLTSELLSILRAELLVSKSESCAILFGRAIVKNNRLARIVVREIQRVGESDYLDRTDISAQLKPEVIACAAQRARKSGESIIFAHSHPFPLNEFSATDNAGEKALREFLTSRIPGVIHAALLVTPEATIARVLGSGDPLQVIGVGANIQWCGKSEASKFSQEYDRQVRAFGAQGQEQLRKITVGIVGLGGTGSIVVEQLAHLGVQKFLLIDPDVVERTNLNRLVGASESDVKRPKVEVAARLAQRINARVEVRTIHDSVLLASVAEEIADTDFVFCCTDSHGSRAVLNQAAYQYLVPSIDMGVAIVTQKGQITHIAGRSQMLAPGLGCLMCGDLLNPEAIRVDLLTDFERAADPYIVGAHEPAPAVISVNATISSISVTMFLAAVAGVPSHARLVNYNGITGAARVASINQHPTCIACSSRGALARGNEWDLPARLA